jgi:uncharacterized protein with NRDE domain
MCTLIFWQRAFKGVPLIVAANRDEQIDRPSAPPTIRRLAQGAILCPTDLLAGGTWIGINNRRLFAAITNRFGCVKHAERRSRGELVTLALEHRNADSAAAAIAALDPRRENAFHLAIADEDSAHLVLCDGNSISQQRLDPGLHVITERSFGAGQSTRETLIRSRLSSLSEPPSDALLTDLLSTHKEDSFEGLCVHLGKYGTRSSTILRVERDIYFQFADGPPHETPYLSIDTKKLEDPM